MKVVAPVFATCITLLVASALFVYLGLDALETLKVFFVHPLSSANGISELALKASPLILIALGLAIGFRANVWNIGAEGMFIIGAIAASWVALRYGDQDHWWVLFAMMVAGAAGGSAWAAIPAWLRIRFNTNEILVTLMLNYVAALVLGFLVRGPWRDPAGFNYPQTALFGPAAMFEPLADASLRVNQSLWLTAIAVVVVWIFMARSFAGYKMAVSGLAPHAARYAGFSASRAIWIGLLAGGATAGVAGMAEVAGPLGQLSPSISPGYGFAAIIVAFIGRLHAFGIVLGGVLLALLYIGGESAQMMLNLPAALTRTFQGMLLFFLLAADFLINYRVRWRPCK